MASSLSTATLGNLSIILSGPRAQYSGCPLFLIAGYRRVSRVGSNALISAATGALIRGDDPGLAAVAGTSMYEQQIG
jgi:hypothetical protein